MYKLLLVEGDDQTRNSISSMINWDKQQCQLMAEARDGEEGLRLFEEVNPDIVITDIHLPMMSGFEMVRHIQREAPGTQFILLSSQEKFSYAKQAMSLGVTSFIVKRELCENVLLRELSRTKDRTYADGKLSFLSAGRDLKAFMGGGSMPDNFSNLLKTPQIQLLCGPTLPQASLLYMDSYEYWFELNHHFRKYGEIVSIVFSDTENMVTIPAGNLNSKQRIRERGLAFAQAFQQYQKEEYHFDVHIALGGLCADAGQLRDSYFRTRSLLMDGVFNQKAAIVESQPKTVDEEAARQVRGYMRDLEHLVEERRYNDAKTSAAAMMDALRSIRFPPLFQEAVMSAELLLGEHAKHSGLVYPYSTISQAKQALLAALDSLEQEQSSRYSRRVRQMLQYIHKNYPAELSLNALAEDMGVTAIYAGQLFKKETGKTFTAYLTEYRMSKAMKLLKSGEHKIYEVGEMVGYPSVPYFSKVFKRVTGKKPSEVLDAGA